MAILPTSVSVALTEHCQYGKSCPPSAPDEAVITGITGALEQYDGDAADISRLVHGTTVATNTVLTREGARVGLLTTKGFRDVLAIAHQARPAIYDDRAHRVEPLIGDDYIMGDR